MAEELSLQYNRSDDTQSLCLLDGPDEIWHGLDTDSDLYGFVEHLLNRPNVIVTSRPSVQILGDINTFDLELETIGFDPAQVKDYVETMEPQNADRILHFLDERLLIADLVRIPIQLDALCFAWNDTSMDFKNSGPVTMTELYQAIERGIWGRDEARLRRLQQAWRIYDAGGTDSVEQSKIILEELAFTGMNNNLTVFDARTMRRLFKDVWIQESKIDLTLQILSVLRSSGVSSSDASRKYYFLHLTLQEFFAAHYIKRQWLKGSEGKLKLLDLKTGDCSELDPNIFLQRHKYDEHFDIVWRFLSGLLGSDPCPQGFQVSFFKTIQSKPLDELGPAHQRLVMRCLFETKHNFLLRRQLEEQLSAWLEFEYSFIRKDERQQSYERSLAGELEFPIGALARSLSSDEELGIHSLESIDLRRKVDFPFLKVVIEWFRNSGNREVVLTALSFIERFFDGRSAAKTASHGGVLQAVVQKLGDQNWSIRQIAIEFLKKQPSLSKVVLQAVVQMLEAGDVDAQQAAIKFLEKQPSLSEAVLEAAVQKLGDKNSSIRQTAIKLLEKQMSLSGAVLAEIARNLGRVTLFDFREHKRLLSILKRNPGLIVMSQSTGSFAALFYFLLRQSFQLHLAWYQYDGKFCFVTDYIAECKGRVPTYNIDQARKDKFVPAVAINS